VVVALAGCNGTADSITTTTAIGAAGTTPTTVATTTSTSAAAVDPTTLLAYALEKRLARDPSRFGHGAPEGVAAPESANNAAASAEYFSEGSLRARMVSPTAFESTETSAHTRSG